MYHNFQHFMIFNEPKQLDGIFFWLCSPFDISMTEYSTESAANH